MKNNFCQQQLHKMQGFSGIAVSHRTFYLIRKYAVTKPCTAFSSETLAVNLNNKHILNEINSNGTRKRKFSNQTLF
jgi:hypothetical protein